MYPIKPRNIYVHERVLDDPRWVATVDDTTLNDISREEHWDRVTRWRTGQYNRTRDPDIIFNTYAWRDDQAQADFVERYPYLRFARLSGAGFVGYRDGEALLESRNGICRNAYDLHSAWGCLHACDYCNVGTFLNILLDLEEMVERLPAILDAHRWCRLWKYDNQTDTITFEPEYGASELMIGAFAERATSNPGRSPRRPSPGRLRRTPPPPPNASRRRERARRPAITCGHASPPSYP